MASRQARRTAASSRSGGYQPSGIGAKARAAASRLKSGGSSTFGAGIPAPPPTLSAQQFGAHHAPASTGSVEKNMSGGGNYVGRHAVGQGRHASGKTAGDTGYVGRHVNWFRRSR